MRFKFTAGSIYSRQNRIGSTLAKAPHHLIGTTPLRDEMNAEKYRRSASRAIDEINSRCKLAIIVGGSGLYIKALTHGLAPLPESDPELREKLNAMSLDDLRSQLVEVDPETARKIDLKNRRRVIRALEICSLTGKPASAQRRQSRAASLARRNGRANDVKTLRTASGSARIMVRLQASLSSATGKSFTNESINEWK